MSYPGDVLIVSGVDGSSASRCAARWAAAEAQRRGGVLRLVYAISPPASGEYPGPLLVRPMVTEPQRRRAGHLLDRAADAVLDEFPGLRLETRSKAGAPAAVLVDESLHAVVTVVGSHRSGPISRVLFGSVAAKVASHGHGGVVVVGAPAAAVSTGLSHGPVVVGVDGFARADAAIGFAFEEAALRDAPLVAVRIGNDRHLERALGGYPLPIDTSEVDDRESQLLSDELAAWAVGFPRVPVQELVLHSRSAAAVLRSVAALDHGRAQLLVVGSRGRGSFAGLLEAVGHGPQTASARPEGRPHLRRVRLGGFTSGDLMSNADCPVAIVREAHITTAA